MNKIKVMTVFGTRPEAIKMAPSEIAVNIKNCLKERYREAGETVAIHAAENMAVSAETLESGKTAGHVLLAITIDRDKIQDVERAVRNLEIVDANLIGYVLVK